MKTTTIAIDVAKNVFEIAVSNRPGKVAQTHRLSRTKLLRFFVQQPAATVVLEACTSAHHWARELEALGHQPVLLPPAYVRPYVRRNKTDHADACAILEAFRNEQIRPVPVKTVPQQTLTALHRLRSQWLGDRVARGFPTARHFASYLGLTSRERSSGQVRRLGRISKQGNSYLRMLLVHGARSLLWAARRREQPDRLQSWALKKQQSRGHNKAAVATANKLARIVWAVWSRHEEYQSQTLAA